MRDNNKLGTNLRRILQRTESQKRKNPPRISEHKKVERRIFVSYGAEKRKKDHHSEDGKDHYVRVEAGSFFFALYEAFSYSFCYPEKEEGGLGQEEQLCYRGT